MRRVSSALGLVVLVSASQSLAATPVTRLSSTPVTAGDLHGFAVHDSKLFGWGFDWDRRLGNGLPQTYSRTSPVEVPGLPLVRAVATGHGHTLVLTKDLTVWAFGDNTYGQVGDNTTTWVNTPKQIPGLTGIIAIAAGPHTSFAVRSTGEIYAWGRNDQGQLGLNNTSVTKKPTQITTLTGIVGVAGGWTHTLAVNSAGKVYAWGYNGYGQLGTGNFTSRLTPQLITLNATVKQVSAGISHSMARDSAGRVWTWGRDILGQLGDSTAWSDRSTPGMLSAPTSVSQISAGESFSMALTTTGEVWSWGANDEKQLGHTSASTFVPTKAAVRDVIKYISAGQNSAFAVDANGQLFAWGKNSDGRLGTGSESATPLAPTRARFAYAYKVLVLLVSQGETDISPVEASMDRLASSFSRLSFGKVTLDFDYAGPYQATEAELACTGESQQDHEKIRTFAGNKAQMVDRIDLSRYDHFISWPDLGPDSACRPAGQSGGVGWESTPTRGAGMTFLTYGWNLYTPNLLVHEFGHGFGSDTQGFVLPHPEYLTCSGSLAYPPFGNWPTTNPACTVGFVPQEFDVMGNGSLRDYAWARNTDVFNVNGIHKSFLNWLAPADVRTVNAVTWGTTTVDIFPIDSPTAPTSGYSMLKFQLGSPHLSTQSYVFEYRKDAYLGVAPEHASLPGVYLYLSHGTSAGPMPFLIKRTHYPASYEGLYPLPLNTTIQLTSTASAKIISVDGTKARIQIINPRP